MYLYENMNRSSEASMAIATTINKPKESTKSLKKEKGRVKMTTMVRKNLYHQIRRGGVVRVPHASPTRVTNNCLLPPWSFQTPDLAKTHWKFQRYQTRGRFERKERETAFESI